VKFESAVDYDTIFCLGIVGRTATLTKKRFLS